MALSISSDIWDDFEARSAGMIIVWKSVFVFFLLFFFKEALLMKNIQLKDSEFLKQITREKKY